MHLRRFFILSALFTIVSLTSRTTAAVPLQTSPRASVLVCGGSMMNGNHFADSTLAVMHAHYAGCQNVALVLFATHPDERDKMEERLREAFAHLGVPAAHSLHHVDATGQRALLEKADGIFVGGGETFVLLRELDRTGMLEVIRQRVLAGIPYGGSSAGANVAGLLIGTTNDFPVADVPSRDALALLPVSINPHHPLPATKAEFDGRAGKIKTYLQFNPTEMVLALANTSIARLHDQTLKLEVGSGWLYTRGGVRVLSPGEVILETAPKS